MATRADDAARDALVTIQSLLAHGADVALGVARTASSAQVHAAFVELAKQFHPSLFNDRSEEIRDLAERVYRGLCAARASLMRASANTRRMTPADDAGGRSLGTPAEGVAVTTSAARPSRGPRDRVRDDASVALDLLQRGHWMLARQLLEAIALREPASTASRSLLSYARGCEALATNRLGEARMQLRDSLLHAPDPDIAKAALATLAALSGRRN
jgi:hypothetical protein